MHDLGQVLIDLGNLLWELVRLLVVEVGGLALQWSLGIAWIAFCLWAIDWRKLWPRLAEGAWAPLALLATMIGLVWGWMFPSEMLVLGKITVTNFWWQLLAVGTVVGVGFFCGWLQGVFGWHPTDVPLEPPPPHGHDHEHAHEHAPAHGH